jgi:hypothetical protein
MKLHEEIAKTAHELYEKSGWIPGRDFENWIEAEKIVRSRLNGKQTQKKQSEETVEEPIKKTAPSEAKKAVEPKRAAEPKKAPAKRTTKPKKTA